MKYTALALSILFVVYFVYGQIKLMEVDKEEKKMKIYEVWVAGEGKEWYDEYWVLANDENEARQKVMDYTGKTRVMFPIFEVDLSVPMYMGE